VLDLFAGTGAVGIEALSRGAASAVFVEKARPALECLRENLALLDLAPPVATVHAADVFSYLKGTSAPDEGPFDLVFCDPPYPLFQDRPAVGRLREGLGALLRTGRIARTARLILEHPARGDPGAPPPGWENLDRRSHSAAGVSLFRPLAPGLGSAT
jgi:16S rRNA (guanine966-N2)-methyltransferase